MEEREIILPYVGSDFEADSEAFYAKLKEIESRHLAFFINRPGIFEDEDYELLKNHFFFIHQEGKVILLQAESSLLPSNIVNEVVSAFYDLFRKAE